MQKEKEFLHDMSGPLSVAFGNSSILLAKLQEDSEQISMEVLIGKLEKVVNSLERVKTSVETRKESLKIIDHPTM